MVEFAYLSARALVAGYLAGAFTPVEVAQALLARIAALDGAVNCIVQVDAARTLAMAMESVARYAAGRPLSKLDGVPVTIKDLSAVAGWQLRRGSRTRGEALAEVDTPAVARLREAGMVFLAKTATPEGGCKVVTNSPVHGVTRNPYDLQMTPGGSSGGAAAALAMGFGPLALGSDGAGSIRIPAALSNVFGLKPGFGRVPAFPPDTDMPMSVVGPMAREVEDAALMLEVMSRPEMRDPFAWPLPFLPPEDWGVGGMRVAVSDRLGCIAPLVDGEVDALVAQAGLVLAQAGAEVLADAPDWPVDPFAPFRVFWEAGCLESVNRHPPERWALLEPLLLKVAEAGRKITLPEFQVAIEQRLALSVAAQAFFNRYDVLVGPVMPVPAYRAERDVPEGFADEDWSWCPYTYPWNLTGLPAASVPIGFTQGGLPVGVQIIGGMGAEDKILRAAAAIEQALPVFQRRPDWTQKVLLSGSLRRRGL
jgi:aspartyl-tRNA(Asn)/glutamyl-tRNA(Gln) amidotransferase subunit A